MDTDGVDEEIATTGDNEAERGDQFPRVAQMIFGWIVAAVIIFLAQRDLRKRPPELVRGPVGLWKAVAMAPPGAVAYLLFGRRRAAAPEAIVEMPNSIAA